MFLHLIPDEKFIDDAISRFERIDPGQHIFIYLAPANPVSFKHLKQTDKITVVPVSSLASNDYLVNIHQFTAVFVHSLLNPHFVEFINQSDKNTIFIWIFWGAELWTLKQFKTKAYLPLTKFLYYMHILHGKWEKLKRNLDKYTSLLFDAGMIKTIRIISGKLIHPTPTHCHSVKDGDVVKAIRRINYIIPVILDDGELLKQLLPCSAKLLEWNYSPGIPLNELSNPVPLCSRNILIGNSAHYTNNHWDIFVKLKKHTELFDKVIVPLSYGDPVYTKAIVRKGTNLLGSKFHPLLDFLPAPEYFSQVSNCYAAIFNSVRQQAMGNIIVSLYCGSKVFLRQENPIYLFLKKQNAVVFSIQKDLNQAALKEPLSADIKARNRNVIRNLYSDETLDKKTRYLLSYLNTQKRPQEGKA